MKSALLALVFLCLVSVLWAAGYVQAGQFMVHRVGSPLEVPLLLWMNAGTAAMLFMGTGNEGRPSHRGAAAIHCLFLLACVDALAHLPAMILWREAGWAAVHLDFWGRSFAISLSATAAFLRTVGPLAAATLTGSFLLWLVGSSIVLSRSSVLGFGTCVAWLLVAALAQQVIADSNNPAMLSAFVAVGLPMGITRAVRASA